MKWRLSILIILAFKLASAQSYQSVNLSPGQYKVGFKSSIHYDLGRPPIKEQQRGFRNGRAVHISIWYPATIKANQEPMPFSVYTNDVARMVNPTPVTERTKKESIYLMKYFLAQLHGDTAVLNTHLPALLKSTTTAYHDATPSPESFPVVIYPESSYQNNIMCEHLASHGYIIVSVSRHGTFDVEFEWQNVRGIESLTQDCQFALGVVKDEFKLTEPGLAVMGVGMNTSAGLAWMMRNPEVDALISLEGGILTGYEYELIQKSPWFDKTKASKPMLVMYSPHESVNAALIDQYKYADRYMLHLPRLSEFYYLNYGVWERSMTGILGPAPGDTKTSFEWETQYALQFLDLQLKQKESARNFFNKTPEQNGASKGIAEYTLKPRYEIPPTDSDLEALKQTSGFAAMFTEARKHLQKDPQALSFDTFIIIGQKLIASKEFDHGTQWATAFQQSYPEAASAFSLAGRCYLELGQKEKAVTFYNAALKLLATDPNFEPAQKDQVKVQIEKRLEQLKG